MLCSACYLRHRDIAPSLRCARIRLQSGFSRPPCRNCEVRDMPSFGDTAGSATAAVQASGRWAHALDLLHELDPDWTELYTRMAIDPWTRQSLSLKEIQLIAVGLSASITNLDASTLRRNIRVALHGGASRAEILEVIKMAAIL